MEDATNPPKTGQKPYASTIGSREASGGSCREGVLRQADRDGFADPSWDSQDLLAKDSGQDRGSEPGACRVARLAPPVRKYLLASGWRSLGRPDLGKTSENPSSHEFNVELGRMALPAPGFPALLSRSTPGVVAPAAGATGATALTLGRMVFCMTSSRSRLFSASGNLINGCPCSSFGLFIRDASILITLLDVLGLSLLFVRVLIFITAWHLRPPIASTEPGRNAFRTQGQPHLGSQSLSSLTCDLRNKLQKKGPVADCDGASPIWAYLAAALYSSSFFCASSMYFLSTPISCRDWTAISCHFTAP